MSIFFEWIIWDLIIFLNGYFVFSFEWNIELNHFLARFNEKMNIQKVSARVTMQANSTFPQRRYVLAYLPDCACKLFSTFLHLLRKEDLLRKEASQKCRPELRRRGYQRYWFAAT